MCLTFGDRRQTSPRRSRQAPKLQQTSANGDAPMTMVDAITADSATPTRIKRVRSSRRVCRVPTMAPPLAHGGRASPSASVIIYCGRTRDDEARRPRPPPRNGGQGPQYPMPRWRAANSLPKVKVLGKQLPFVACGGSIEKDKNGAPHSTLPPRCGIIGSWTDVPWNGSATTS